MSLFVFSLGCCTSFYNPSYIRTLFIKESFKDHLESIERYRDNILLDDKGYNAYFFKDYIKHTSIHLEQFLYLKEQSEKRNSVHYLIDFSLSWLRHIGSFDSTSYVFKTMIFPLFEKLNKEDFVRLLDIMQENNQISGDKNDKHLYVPLVQSKAKEALGDEFEHAVLKW